MLPTTLEAELAAFQDEYERYLAAIIVKDSALHITTQEGIRADVTVSDAGWCIQSQVRPFERDLPSETMSNEAAISHFPTSQALLSHLSPAFNAAWAAHLLDALSKVGESL